MNAKNRENVRLWIDSEKGLVIMFGHVWPEHVLSEHVWSSCARVFSYMWFKMSFGITFKSQSE